MLAVQSIKLGDLLLTTSIISFLVMFLLSLGYRNLGQTVLVGGRPSNSHWLKMITHFKVIKKNAAAAKSLQSNSKERLTLNRVFPQILWGNTAERRNLEPKHDQLTDILCDNQNLFYIYLLLKHNIHIFLYSWDISEYLSHTWRFFMVDLS